MTTVCSRGGSRGGGGGGCGVATPLKHSATNAGKESSSAAQALGARASAKKAVARLPAALSREVFFYARESCAIGIGGARGENTYGAGAGAGPMTHFRTIVCAAGMLAAPIRFQ